MGTKLQQVKKYCLGALLDGADKLDKQALPSVEDLESILFAFKDWEKWYIKEADEYRVRATKLELIQDIDARRERDACNSAVENASRCVVGARALEWAIKELKTCGHN